MEEAFLRFRLVAEELDVVDDEQVYVAVKCDELVIPVGLERLHIVRREVVARRIKDIVIAVLPDMVADSLHKVRFAQADSAIDQQRVEGRMARLLGDGQRGAARELVAIAFDESVEGVRGVQRKAGCNEDRARRVESVCPGMERSIRRRRARRRRRSGRVRRFPGAARRRRGCVSEGWFHVVVLAVYFLEKAACGPEPGRYAPIIHNRKKFRCIRARSLFGSPQMRSQVIHTAFFALYPRKKMV